MRVRNIPSDIFDFDIEAKTRLFLLPRLRYYYCLDRNRYILSSRSERPAVQ